MHVKRPALERFHTQIDWLDSYHTFSFGHHHDPGWMGFRSLRVINEDVIAGGGGFGTHPHRDMEILTVVLSGELEHKDSMGNGEVLRPNEIQVMSAGTGIQHSEFNPSPTEPVRLLQIWMLPEERNLTPRYDQKKLPAQTTTGVQTLASRHPDQDSAFVQVFQDIRLDKVFVRAGESLTIPLAESRYAWIQTIQGVMQVVGQGLGQDLDESLQAGDGLAVGGDVSAAGEVPLLTFTATQDTLFLLFDMN
jgi:quercetin 2,3-dioxygenase